MRKRISGYTISIIFCLFTLQLQAQKKIIEQTDTTASVPLYNGINIQADLGSVVSSAISKGETYSYEAGINVDLKRKYYPVLEMGFAGANKTSNNNAVFSTNAPFFRMGIDINMLKNKDNTKITNNIFVAGARLGFSSFNYKLSGITVTDDYWGGTQSVLSGNYNATKVWWEIVAGVRVEVFKNFYMGWMVRDRNQISKDDAGSVTPWYIPGFGINTANNWGFNYSIGYHF